MKHAPAILSTIAGVLLCLPVIADSDNPPTYKGLLCIGWVKPEAQAIADGDSSGEELVVNTPLTEREKRDLYYARQEADAAFKKERATEDLILSRHHLLLHSHSGSDWLRYDACGNRSMIRDGEYHITQFVPSNPNYPGDNNSMMAFYGGDAKTCRAHFAEMRKRAVTAKYGAEASDAYTPDSH
jgi:hypothetical protein